MCIDWQESSNEDGGWLVTGCNNGTVGVSWIEGKGSVKLGKGRRTREKKEQESAGDEDCATELEDDERSRERSNVPEDNLACTKEACLYKSHFILRSHTGEVNDSMSQYKVINTF